MKVAYLPIFVKQYKKLPEPLRLEVLEKIDLFKKDPKHPFLKVHKLKGSLADRWSFSVNYEYRIMFAYISKDEVVLMNVGNHDIYKN